VSWIWVSFGLVTFSSGSHRQLHDSEPMSLFQDWGRQQRLSVSCPASLFVAHLKSMLSLLAGGCTLRVHASRFYGSEPVSLLGLATSS
jgi:hypothetical protein